LKNVEGFNSVNFDGSHKELRYQIVDSFGKAAKIKSIKTVTMRTLDSTEPKDITEIAELIEEGSMIKIVFENIMEMQWRGHVLKFELGNGSFNTK